MAYSVRTVRNITYREIDGNELQLDLHVPEGVDAPPVVAYFHGGGFEEGVREMDEAGRLVPLAKRGLAVATFSYRLVDKASFPAQLDDARFAIEWLQNHGSELGVNATQLGIMGSSAGGYLAAMLGLGVPAAGIASVGRAVVPVNPMLDLSLMINGSPLENEIFPLGEDGGLLGGFYERSNPEHRALNPMANIHESAPDFLLITGDRDRVIEPGQSERFHTALTIAGVPSSLITVGGVGHEDPRLEAPEIIAHVAEFFLARLR